MEGRREARERALGLLYEAAAKGSSVAEIVDELPVPPSAYAAALAAGVDDSREKLDEVIARHVKEGWALDRMPQVDLTVLRIAAYELAYEPDVPIAVVISEAVELAKQYSTDDSGRFVNGVLREVAAEVRPGG